MKSKKLTEGKTKSNVKDIKTGRQAPPPPPVKNTKRVVKKKDENLQHVIDILQEKLNKGVKCNSVDVDRLYQMIAEKSIFTGETVVTITLFED